MKLWFRRGGWTSKKARDIVSTLSRDNVKNIAVIRHAALGDMVLTRCFLIELRQAFPNATITLSVTSNYTRGTPDDLVDRVHTVHGSDQRDTPFRERKKRFKELGTQDIIFDLAATNRSFMTCFFNDAKLKIGFPYRRIQSKLFYDISVPRSDLNFELDNMLSMLHALGIKTRYPQVFDMPGEALQRERPYMIYFAGASVPSKCWPTENFKQLMIDMAQRYPQHEHLLLEGLQDWEKAASILQDTRRDNIAAIEADTIEDTVALLKGAQLVVANDTGIRNLAIVCDIPTVGIFFDTEPFRYWPRCSNHELVIPQQTATPSVGEVFQGCESALARAGIE